MNPKLLLCLALALSGGPFNFANASQSADESPAIKVLIGIPQFDTAPDRWKADHKPVWTRKLRNSGPNPHFFVIIENISSRPLVLTGWAANGGILGNLSFELTDSDGKNTVVPPIIPPATVNAPENQKLDAGQATVVKIDYATTNKWLMFFNHRFPFPQTGHSRKLKMRAVFEEGPFAGANAKAHFWSGTAISQPYEVIFKG